MQHVLRSAKRRPTRLSSEKRLGSIGRTAQKTRREYTAILFFFSPRLILSTRLSPAATTVFLSTPTIFEATRLGTTSSSNAFPSHINAAHFRSVYLDAKENVANEHEDAEQPSDTSSEEIEWKEPKSDFDFRRENGGGSSESTVEEYDDDKTTLMAAEKTDGETVEPLMGLSPGVGMGCETPSGEKKVPCLDFVSP